MPTYLHIDELRTDSAQKRYRSEYELRHFDYELMRSINHKGDITSDVIGSRIRVVMEGFGDEELFDWLFSPAKRKNGEIVTNDGNEKAVEKFTFTDARAVKYRLHFDANMKKPVTAVLVIEVGEIVTENHLHYKRK